jgi:hypothetical protein
MKTMKKPIKKSTTSKFQLGGTTTAQKAKFKNIAKNEEKFRKIGNNEMVEYQYVPKLGNSIFPTPSEPYISKPLSGRPFAKPSAVQSPTYKKGGSVKKVAKPKARKK